MAETPPHPVAPPHRCSPLTPERAEASKRSTNNGRAEIDMSPPFRSVREAIEHFEGLRTLWTPLHLPRRPRSPATGPSAIFNIARAEEEAAELEKDLNVRERETRLVLSELETAKRILEALKLAIQKDASQCLSTPRSPSPLPVMENASSENSNLMTKKSISVQSPGPSPSFILTELKQAKSNLSRTTDDLAVITTSVESLNDRMTKEKLCIGGEAHRRFTPSDSRRLATGEAMQGGSPNLTNISAELRQLNLAADQFINMAEASKCEVLRAMSEIEDTKASFNTAEMRWVAAKKMEEAAMAVEAVALAEMNSLKTPEMDKSESARTVFGLAHDDPQRQISRKKVADAVVRLDEEKAANLEMLRELGKATQEAELSRRALEAALNGVDMAGPAKLQAREALRRWRMERGRQIPFDRPPFPSPRESRVLFDVNNTGRPGPMNQNSKPVPRPSISLKDVLSRKPFLPEEGRRKVPLSEMLRLQRAAPSASGAAEDGRRGIDDGRVVAQRKKLGFIHISLPLPKSGRKRMQCSSPRPPHHR